MFVKPFILGPSITTNKELSKHISPRFNYFLLTLRSKITLFTIISNFIFKLFKEVNIANKDGTFSGGCNLNHKYGSFPGNELHQNSLHRKYSFITIYI